MHGFRYLAVQGAQDPTYDVAGQDSGYLDVNANNSYANDPDGAYNEFPGGVLSGFNQDPTSDVAGGDPNTFQAGDPPGGVGSVFSKQAGGDAVFTAAGMVAASLQLEGGADADDGEVEL